MNVVTFYSFMFSTGLSDRFDQFRLDGFYWLDWFVLQDFPTFSSMMWAHMSSSLIT